MVDSRNSHRDFWKPADTSLLFLPTLGQFVSYVHINNVGHSRIVKRYIEVQICA